MASRPVISTSVAVHLHRDGRVFFLPYSETENGFDVFDGLPEVVNSIDDASELGRALEAAMARSFARVLPAVDLRAPDRKSEILEWMKKSSWGQYSRGVRSVSITVSSEFPEGTLDLRPLQNKGPRGGFEPVRDTRFQSTYESVEDLGRLVQRAMEMAI